jgi:putative ABC transport system permease protein
MIGFLWTLAWRSAWNRRFTLALTMASIALSTFMLLGTERIRTDIRGSFTSAVSGTDLIVGARTGSHQLLLYAVFHVGAATNTIRWSTVQALAQQRGVDWIIPLSLGDSHRGFPVLGTTSDYFTHFHYGDHQPLRLVQGQPLSDLFDAVLGAEVAARLGYRLGDRMVLSHGSGELDLSQHADKPFVVRGILAPTGTPVDRTVHISLQAMQALHVDWMAGAPLPGRSTDADKVRQMDLTPRAVTAVLVGLKSRSGVFSAQRFINTFTGEPLMAILPGVALDELWDVIGAGEKALLLMSALVALVSLAGLVSVVMAGLNERRRELAVLRAVGASPFNVLVLLMIEGAMVTIGGVLIGIAGLGIAAAALGPWLQSRFGLALDLLHPTEMQWLLLGALVLAGWLASLVPGWRAYRLSLSDGLSPRT